MKRLLALTALVAMTTVGLPGAPALGAEAYVIGISGALTGRGSGTYAPVIEAIKIYFDEINDKGGINGHPVELVIEDNQAEPSRAAADVKKLINQDEVILVINASLSSTYAPMVAETKRAGVALLFAGGVCPNEVYPPADRLQFCTTAYNISMDMDFAMNFIKEEAKGAPKVGFAGMAIPLVRAGYEKARAIADEMGIEVVDEEIIPPPTADYAPFAAKIKDAGAEWGFSWSPWITQVKTFEALRKLGWQGDYLTYAHIVAESELERLKDPGFYVFGANALMEENLPVQDEIRRVAEARGAAHPVDQLSEGWVAALVLDAVLRKTGWPADRQKVIAAMNDIEVDTRGLRGGPLVWTKDNHFRTTHWYRVYRWDENRGGIVTVKDWVKAEVQ